mgnify:CR=1 FL=1
MAQRYSKPLKIKGIASPLLRPLPVLFSFLNLAQRHPHQVSESVRSLFTSHLRAFRAILVALGRGTALPPDATAQLVSLCDRLAMSGTSDPGWRLVEGKQALRRLQEQYGPELLRTARRQKDHLAELFRTETGPLRLEVVHHDETAERGSKIRARLVDECWYDCRIRHENEGFDGLTAADLVLLVPSATPIRSDLVQALGEHETACLVLIRTGTAGPNRDMAALRSSHLYRKEGHAVMQGPSVPLRLYQTVDRLVLYHRAVHPTAEKAFMAGN